MKYRHIEKGRVYGNPLTVSLISIRDSSEVMDALSFFFVEIPFLKLLIVLRGYYSLSTQQLTKESLLGFFNSCFALSAYRYFALTFLSATMDMLYNRLACYNRQYHKEHYVRVILPFCIFHLA